MVNPDFPLFVLQLLEREGMIFSDLDFSLFQRDAITWSQLKKNKQVSRTSLGDSIFTKAAKLKFVEREPGHEYYRRPPRIQARFELWPGDLYWICAELSLEEALTRFYRSQSWSLLPEEPSEVPSPTPDREAFTLPGA